MSEVNANLGRTLRLIVSEGWADEDPDLIAQLLEKARTMAALILADDAASPELYTIAADFLEQLGADSLGSSPLIAPGSGG